MKKYLLLTIFFVLSLENMAQLQLPKLISNHLILQRDKPLLIWGKSNPNAEVLLTFDTDSFVTRADETGNWEIPLPAQSAGGPHTLGLALEYKSSWKMSGLVMCGFVVGNQTWN